MLQSGLALDHHVGDEALHQFDVLEWSDRWVTGAGREALIVTERASGERVPRLRILSTAGRELKSADLHSSPGPGTDVAILRLFEFAARGQALRTGEGRGSKHADQDFGTDL